jgi:hypothetical protein
LNLAFNAYVEWLMVFARIRKANAELLLLRILILMLMQLTYFILWVCSRPRLMKNFDFIEQDNQFLHKIGH